jgi:putative heme iron utilization protein
MVLYAARSDLSDLFIHVSRLALHTGGLLAEPRVGLLIAEPDRPSRNPLSMARVSILGIAEPLEPDSTEFAEAREAYIAAHPNAAFNFELGDFLLIRIRPSSARFVAGFGRIVDLDAADWARLTTE